MFSRRRWVVAGGKCGIYLVEDDCGWSRTANFCDQRNNHHYKCAHSPSSFSQSSNVPLTVLTNSWRTLLLLKGGYPRNRMYRMTPAANTSEAFEQYPTSIETHHSVKHEWTMSARHISASHCGYPTIITTPPLPSPPPSPPLQPFLHTAPHLHHYFHYHYHHHHHLPDRISSGDI